MRRLIAVLSGVFLAAFALPASEAVRLPAVFSEHTVLQCGMPVPVRGTADAGEKVTVKFRDQTKTGTTGADGKWSVKLDPLKAGGPDTLTVNEVTLADVLVGEVWIGSGQWNMDLGVGFFAKGDPLLAQLANATYPQIRCGRSGGAWRTAEPKGNLEFSALLFAFGVQLHKELGVPVGLMQCAANGSAAGPWLTEEMLKADAPAQAALAKATEVQKSSAQQKKYEEALAAWELAAQAARENKSTVAGVFYRNMGGRIRTVNMVDVDWSSMGREIGWIGIFYDIPWYGEAGQSGRTANP